MNMTQLINMVIRMVTRRLLDFGVNKGIDMVAGRGKSGEEMSGAERKQAQQMRGAVKQARKAAGIARRLR